MFNFFSVINIYCGLSSLTIFKADLSETREFLEQIPSGWSSPHLYLNLLIAGYGETTGPLPVIQSTIFR